MYTRFKVECFPSLEVEKEFAKSMMVDAIKNTEVSPEGLIAAKESIDNNNPNVALLQYEDGVRLTGMASISIEGEKYWTLFPDPIQCILNMALMSIDSYNELCKHIPAYDNIKIIGDRKFLGTENGYVNNHFSNLMGLKMNAIIMLYTAFDAFINRMVNDATEVAVNRNKEVVIIDDSMNIQKLHFRDRMDHVIPAIAGTIKFWDGHADIQETLEEMNIVRNKIIHIKKTKDDFEAYREAIKLILDASLENYLNHLIKFMNLLNPKFITP